MTQGNGNGSHRASFTEGVAQRVIDACQREDPNARITYVGRDEDERTRVRVRSGGAASVQALQRALATLMPFAKVRTSEDVLDGTAQAEIIVPTARDEYEMAYSSASQKLTSRLASGLAFSLAMVGVGMWISGMANTEARDI